MTPSSRALNSVRAPGGRLLRAIDQIVSRPLVAWVLLTLDGLWVVCSVVAGFPARWETIFQTVVAAVTVALVFVIQHTQAREQLVVQRKLDEILSALPHASNTVIGLEDAPEDHLEAVHADHRQRQDHSTRPEARSGSGRELTVGGPR